MFEPQLFALEVIAEAPIVTSPMWCRLHGSDAGSSPCRYYGPDLKVYSVFQHSLWWVAIWR